MEVTGTGAGVLVVVATEGGGAVAPVVSQEPQLKRPCSSITYSGPVPSPPVPTSAASAAWVVTTARTCTGVVTP